MSIRSAVQVGRIQNFGSWSPYLIKEGRTCLGLEFFVFEGDSTWNKPDAELIEQGKRELGILGLVEPSKVEAGFVVRMPKAYPFYDEHYKANVAKPSRFKLSTPPMSTRSDVTAWHAAKQPGIHSMYTAMLMSRNRTRSATKHVERQRRGCLSRGGQDREIRVLLRHL